jgi:ribosome maturation factor RimP
MLDVTSPGTSRPLTELRHFKRARTRLVNLTLVDGSTVSGRLTEVTAAELVVTGDTGETVLPLADVKKGRVVVELKRPKPDAQATIEDREEDC